MHSEVLVSKLVFGCKFVWDFLYFAAVRGGGAFTPGALCRVWYGHKLPCAPHCDVIARTAEAQILNSLHCSLSFCREGARRASGVRAEVFGPSIAGSLAAIVRYQKAEESTLVKQSLQGRLLAEWGTLKNQSENQIRPLHIESPIPSLENTPYMKLQVGSIVTYLEGDGEIMRELKTFDRESCGFSFSDPCNET
eukprot:5555377-Amphidinium_carterae.1